MEGRAFMKKRKTYQGEFKAAIVVDLIKGKKSLAELAEQHELHPNQIKNWKSQFLKQAAVLFKDKRMRKRYDD
jgi:transposase-like protein